MSMYSASRTKFLLSTLPAHYQDEPDSILSGTSDSPSNCSTMSFFDPKIRTPSIKPSRSKFISHQLHTQISHTTASLLQSKLLAIYFPAWSQFNFHDDLNGFEFNCQLNGLNSNRNSRDLMTADLRLIWFGYKTSKNGGEEEKEEDLESSNREFIIKDLGGGGEKYSKFVRESFKSFTFLSIKFELAYSKLFEKFHNAKTIQDKDFILFQIEQIDIVVLVSIMKQDINELEFRGERITPLLESHTLSDNAEREVFGGLVRLLQNSEEYTVVCISTISQSKVTREGTNEISNFLELGAPFPVFPFFKSNRAQRFDPGS